jgi:hypothetical protein
MPTKYLKSIELSRVFSYESFAKALAALPTEETALKCPAGCGRLLDVAKAEVAISWCPSCHGVWFDRGEIRDLLERMPWYIDEASTNVGASARLLPAYHVPLNVRLAYVGGSAALIVWGALGAWLDDIYLAGSGGGVHFHGIGMWFIAGSMVGAAMTMLSVVADHYDKRPNERTYKRFARVTFALSLLSFAAAFILSIIASVPTGTDKPIAVWLGVLASVVFSFLLGILLEGKTMDAQFRALRRSTTQPHVEFDGSTATVILDRKDGDFIHRICKSAQGDYFLYIYIARASPYLTPLTRARAMEALRGHRDIFEREFGPDA